MSRVKVRYPAESDRQDRESRPAATDKGWVKRFPSLKKSVTIKGETGSISVETSMQSEVSTWNQDSQDKPIRERVDAIVKNLYRLEERQCKDRKSINRLRSDLDKHITKTTADHEDLKGEVRTELETLHTSDLTLSLVGLLWLTLGLTMSIWAQELASLA